jgi:hypothetical protein
MFRLSHNINTDTDVLLDHVGHDPRTEFAKGYDEM